MSTEYVPEAETTASRKRAAVVLGTLVLVAAVVGIVMITLLNDGGDTTGVAGPTQSYVTTPTPTSPSSVHSTPTGNSRRSTTPPTTPPVTPPTTPATTPPTTPPTGSSSCPGSAACILDGDRGGAVAAINAYRTSHGKAAVTGTVSAAAQRCALSNGGDCHGSWAESQVPNGSGQAALAKILSRGHVLSDFRAFEIGWAFDPGSKQYFFAMIRTG